MDDLEVAEFDHLIARLPEVTGSQIRIRNTNLTYGTRTVTAINR
jgi:hypothetical protein